MKLYDEKGNVIPEITSAGQPVAKDPKDDPNVVIFELPNEKKGIERTFGVKKSNRKVDEVFEEYCQNSLTRSQTTVIIPYVPYAYRQVNPGCGQFPSSWLIFSIVTFVFSMLATTAYVHDDVHADDVNVISIVFLSLSALLFLRTTNSISDPFWRAYTSHVGAFASLIAGTILVSQHEENPGDLVIVVGMESLALHALFCGVACYAVREHWDFVRVTYGTALATSGTAALFMVGKGIDDRNDGKNNHLSTAAGIGLGAVAAIVLTVWLAKIFHHQWRQRQERIWNARDEEARGEQDGLFSTQHLHAYNRGFRGQQPYASQSNIQAGSINNDLDPPNHVHDPSYVPMSNINISRNADNRPSS